MGFVVGDWLVVVRVSALGSHTHFHKAASDVDETADQEDAEDHGERKQHEAAKRLCEQCDPDFDLVDGEGDQRSDHQHRNGDDDGNTRIHFGELAEMTGWRKPVLQFANHEP